MTQVKIRILIPFGEGMEVGDIMTMSQKAAAKTVKEGYVEYVKLKTTSTVLKEQINPVTQILERHKASGSTHIEIFGADDKKSGKRPTSQFLQVAKTSSSQLEEVGSQHNKEDFGVFLNINPLDKPKRIKANVMKILYLFIDLDDAQDDHNGLVMTTLHKLGMTYSYNGKSGHGYHFLVPVDMDKANEPKVKGFLTYLRENCTSKVDLATADLGRLMRLPGSIHNKDEESKELVTLHSHMPSEEEIKKNSELMLEYQIEQKKGKKDVQYQKGILKKDVFFSEILNSPVNWASYYNLLNSAKDRNSYFVKNLGIFVSRNSDSESTAISFLSNWEASRVSAMQGWKTKTSENDMQVNYYELMKWSKTNNLSAFTKLLLKQNATSFLDKYEIYYLEDEKKDNAYLLYYPGRNYYVNKSESEIFTNIHYDCLEAGIDIFKELYVDQIEDWEDMSYSKQLFIMCGALKKKLHNELRIRSVFNINYAPIDDKFVYYNGKKFFNTYNKTELWDFSEKQTKYQFKNIKDLLMNLCGDNEEYYNYFNNWLSWIIKNPTQKLPTAIIMQGKQGSGKGTLKNLLLDQIFGENCQEINQTHLESAFNEYLMGKQIIVANEVMHNENRQTLPNVLKNLVTDETLTISRKFKKEIVGRNYTHWIFCTNSDNPIKIEEDDRRYSVFYSKKLKKSVAKGIRENLDYELKEYISYLKSLEPTFDEVGEPIMTEAKKEIIEINKDSVVRFLEYLKGCPTYRAAHTDIFKNDEELSAFKVSDEEFVKTDSLYLLYYNWGKKFGERALFSKQNFGKKIITYGLTNVIKKVKGTSIRSYSMQLLDNFLKDSEDDPLEV